MRKRKIFQLGKGNHSNQKKENIPIKKEGNIPIREKGKLYQSEIGNSEMTEEEEDKNKRIRLREQARGQK